MAHEVSLDLNTKIVLNKDVQFQILKNGLAVGRLLISKGNIEWLPPNKQKNGQRLSWDKFAELMETEGKPVKVRNHASKKAKKSVKKAVKKTAKKD